MADDAPVFANPSAGVVDGLGSGLGVDAGGSGLGVGTEGSGVGVGAGVLGSGVTLGVGTGVLGSGLGVGTEGSGVGVGAGVLGSGVGAGGSGLGVGTEGSGVCVGAGVLGSGVGAGLGSGHSCVELSHSTQPFPLHSPAKGAAWDLPPNRRIVPRRPTRVASRAILSGVRLLGLVVMIFPFVGGALM